MFYFHAYKVGMNNKSICIAGIGNTLRSDVGVGDYVCRLMEEKNLDGVSTIIMQQLDIGMTEDFIKYDIVIFVDASIEEKAFSFQPLAVENNQPQSFSHHINAAMLVSLAQVLYSASTRFYICAVGADQFEMGNTISEKTMGNALASAAFLTGWIEVNH